MNLVSAWQNFFVIVGSSAGGLIGIQFVVIVLIATMRKRTNLESINAFGTPTVVHFGGALTLSAFMSAPWPSLLAASIALVACGLGGFVYGAIVFRRARRQKEYRPVPEDWLWYAVLPCGIYGALALAAILLPTMTRVALFVIGGGTLSLLLLGVRNAWDTVIFIAIADAEGDATKPK